MSDDFCLEHGRDYMRCDKGPIPYCAKCETDSVATPAAPVVGRDSQVAFYEEEIARLVRGLELPDFKANGFTETCQAAARELGRMAAFIIQQAGEIARLKSDPWVASALRWKGAAETAEASLATAQKEIDRLTFRPAGPSGEHPGLTDAILKNIACGMDAFGHESAAAAAQELLHLRSLTFRPAGQGGEDAAREECAKIVEGFMPDGPDPIGPLHGAGRAFVAKHAAAVIRLHSPAPVEDKQP